MKDFDFDSRRKFYDPLYQIVLFSKKLKRMPPRGFYYKGEDEVGGASVSVSEFNSIIDCYEFKRLNFLHQAGLTWLTFPSATHTRFAHSLGCWHLSERAAETVYVRNGKGPGLTTLGGGLEGWLDDFQLSLLLHDIGHFPFSHVIENNDILVKNYNEQDETKGILLNHEYIGRSHILGGNIVSDLFREFMSTRIVDPDPSRFLSHCLSSGADASRRQKISFLLDPSDARCGEVCTPIESPFLLGVHDLISGVVDLDRLDHYRRDSFFISISQSEFNVEGLLHHMMLSPDSARYKIQLYNDGIDHAFQMLYAKSTLARTVFNNKNNIACEMMLNQAINWHWPQAEGDFKKYLPFLDDGELLVALQRSKNKEAANLVHRIKTGDFFSCAGHFFINEGGFEGGNTEERRRSFIAKFDAQCRLQNFTDRVFLRLDKQFGRVQKEREWMDLRRLFNSEGKPLSVMPDRKAFVDFIKESDELASRTFWLFTPAAPDRQRIAALVKALGGSQIT